MIDKILYLSTAVIIFFAFDQITVYYWKFKDDKVSAQLVLLTLNWKPIRLKFYSDK